MRDRKLLWTGAVGGAVAAVCCFTPLPVILLGALGVSVWLGWADYILFPMLALSLGMMALALVRMRRR
ncbi:MAG: mercury resistance system transport protein MerF [Proteobacteria bacterium]|nr:mercury resistance system transport protein MerF [Pseudomonadota bacterium]